MSVLEKSFIKADDLMARNIAGETLIVPIRNRVGDLSSIYTLNEVGARVWQMIDPSRSVNQIVETISDEYDVARAEAARDVVELLDSMESAGLIRSIAEG
ncbi:MAG: hypothetical protein DMF68_14055 [Acidobacteria bacterium]|nr:MAG: hypothetical protein DMF68_14055 [Acidobacteriota bacterium]